MKLTYILFFSTFVLIGQNIKGVILDQNTKTSIENVSIYFKKEHLGTSSNTKGEFSLKLKSILKKTDSIYFSCIGYYTKALSLYELKNNSFKIFLSKKNEALKTVTIKSSKILKPRVPYKTLKSLKKGVYGYGSQLINNKIYVIGGDISYIEDTGKKALLEIQSIAEPKLVDLIKRIGINPTHENYTNLIQIYDIENDSWETSKLKFSKRAYHNINLTKNNLYVLGGKRLSKFKQKEYLDSTIEVLNLKTDSIVTDYTNPHQAINFASFNYNDNIIIMGGSIKKNKKGNKEYSNKSHIYNANSGYWYALKNMTLPKEVKGVLIKDYIYLIGGFNEKPLTTIECYSIKTGKWKPEANLFSGISYPALTQHNNIIYIYNNNKILTYNIITKTLKEFEINLNIKHAMMHYYNKQLYIFGGFIENEYSIAASSYLFNIDVNDFENTQIIQSKSFNHN